jgi:DNA-binding NarL/FixJ family response regulator
VAVIVACGTDAKRLMDWSAILHQAGHDGVILPPTRLLRSVPDAAVICVFDLGERPGVAVPALLAAIEGLPALKFIALTAKPDAQEGLALLRAGVRGYCNRLASGPVFSALVSSVDHGEIWAGRQVTDYLLARSLAEPQTAEPVPAIDLFAKLTPREAEIARQVASGLANKVIAADNGISERTVKAHLNAIFRKTGVSNRVQLALAVSQQEQGRQLSHG